MKPSVNQALRDEALHHAIALTKYEDEQIRKIRATLQAAHDSLLSKIALTKGEWSRAWLTATLKKIENLYTMTNGEITKEFLGNLKELSASEISLATATLGKVLSFDTGIVGPAPAQVWAATMTSPADAGHVLENIMTSFGKSLTDRVSAAVRQSVVEGETVSQMTRRIREAQLPSGHSAEVIARTAVMHVSNVAHDQVYQANSDLIKGLQWVATLDTRTCQVCGGRDGKIYKPGEPSPLPPAHFQCRCVRVPVTKSWEELGAKVASIPEATRASMDGQVPAKQTYREWLKNQPRERLEEIFGVKGAAAFMSGQAPDRFTVPKPLPAPPVIPSLPEKVPEMKNVKALGAWVESLGLAERADFQGLKMDVATETTQAWLDHVRKYPQHKGLLKIIGSDKGRNTIVLNSMVDKAVQRYRQMNGVEPSEFMRKNIVKTVRASMRRSGLLNGSTGAYWAYPEYRSIAVGVKYHLGDYKAVGARMVAQKWWQPYGDTVTATVHHEIGHFLDDEYKVIVNHWSRIKLPDESKAGISSMLSEYGAKNRAETIAEGWSEYVTSSAPREYARLIGQLIEKLIRGEK